MGTAARDLEQQRDRQADRSAAQCRICATDIATDDGGMHIFAEDGRRHYLQTKIRKYLHILVSETRAHFRAYLRAADILFFPSPFFFSPLIFSLLFAPSFFLLFKIRPPPLLYAASVAITCRSRRNFEIHIDARPISADFSRSVEIAHRSSSRRFDRDDFL